LTLDGFSQSGDAVRAALLWLYPRLSLVTRGSLCIFPRKKLATPSTPPIAIHTSGGMLG
jgi:hypothetical protein